MSHDRCTVERWHVFWGFLLLLGALPILAQEAIPGLPKTVNDGKPVSIKIYGLPSLANAYTVPDKASLAVANAFMARYPNIKLEPFSFIKVPAGGDSAMAQDTDILMSMAAGTAPDVLMVNFRQSDTFIRQGFLLPLDSYVDTWKSTPDGKAELDRLIPVPEVWKVIKRVGPDGKAHVWALPPGLLVSVLQYRKDLLRGAGLDPEKPPKTMEEFYRMCVQVCDPAQGIYAFNELNSWRVNWILWSFGAEILSPEKANPNLWVASYDNDAAVQAMCFSWKLNKGPWAICPTCHAHYALNPGDTVGACPSGHRFTVQQLADKKALNEGVCCPKGTEGAVTAANKLAFTTNYMSDLQLSSIDPAVTGIARVPAGPGGVSSAEINASMLGINGTVTDPAKRDAAWAYIRFKTSLAARRITTQVFVENGFGKFLNPQWLRIFGYAALVNDVPPGWEALFNDALQDGHPEPYGTNAQQIYVEMNTPVDRVNMLPTPDVATVKALLHEGVIQTNIALMKKIPPEKKRQQNTVAWIVVVCSVMVFAFLFKFTLQTYGKALADPAQKSHVPWRKLLLAWLLMLPALAAILLFQYYPLLRGSVIAFQDYHLLTPTTWVGVSNFGDVLFAPEFWQALGRSLLFAAISLGCGFCAPIVLAILLHEIPRGSLVFRIIYFLPSVTTGIVVMLLWKQLFDPTDFGLLNQCLAMLHLQKQAFLADPTLVMFWVVLPSIWMGLGPGCIIYLACLGQIPQEYYESADIDGAGFLSKLRAITIPYLKPLLIINFVGACVGAVKSFETVMVMTGGGPAGSSKVLGMAIWQNSFMYLRYGYGTAMGWILASLLIGFTIFQLSYLSKVQFRLQKSD